MHQYLCHRGPQSKSSATSSLGKAQFDMARGVYTCRGRPSSAREPGTSTDRLQLFGAAADVVPTRQHAFDSLSHALRSRHVTQASLQPSKGGDMSAGPQQTLSSMSTLRVHRHRRFFPPHAPPYSPSLPPPSQALLQNLDRRTASPFSTAPGNATSRADNLIAYSPAGSPDALKDSSASVWADAGRDSATQVRNDGISEEPRRKPPDVPTNTGQAALGENSHGSANVAPGFASEVTDFWRDAARNAKPRLDGANDSSQAVPKVDVAQDGNAQTTWAETTLPIRLPPHAVDTSHLRDVTDPWTNQASQASGEATVDRSYAPPSDIQRPALGYTPPRSTSNPFFALAGSRKGSPSKMNKSGGQMTTSASSDWPDEPFDDGGLRD
ncbi:hypothetical protein MRB53_039030 [Persea americana]|nr:hypothetical protein MRB53_039030 [Persea americana]